MEKSKGRNSQLILSHHSTGGVILAAFLLSFIPAFLTSCSQKEEILYETGTAGSGKVLTDITLKSISNDSFNSIDIFFYNKDKAGRLDSWQRMEYVPGKAVRCASGAGEKRIVAIANLKEELELSDINSFGAISGFLVDLAKEDPSHPVMSATATANAGYGKFMILTPLMSRIRIKSIRCDFSGRSYRDGTLRNAKAYLINVNRRCSIIGEDQVPVEIMNDGRLDESETESMDFPGMLCMDIGNVGQQTVRPEGYLYCYPNGIAEETDQTHFTRLVIEGEIDGNTYYYPINLKLRKNLNCDLDILITRTGTDNPDLCAETGTLQVVSEMVPWDDKDRQTVTFSFMKPSPVTRSTDPDEELLTDINFFLFNSDDMLEETKYMDKYEVISGGTQFSIRLLKNVRYSAYMVANAGYRLTGIRTKDDLLDYRYHLVYPDDYREGIPMSAMAEDFLPGDNNTIKMDLERLMAKITLDIDRTTLDSGVRFVVRGVRIGGCPKSALLFGPSRAENERDIFSPGFSKSYGQLDPLNTDVTLGHSGNVSVYMLENMQGDNQNILCSYIELSIDYSSEDYSTPPGEFLKYRFYVGESEGNYDIRRNTSYHFSVKPTGSGLEGTSWSVDKGALEE